MNEVWKYAIPVEDLKANRFWLTMPFASRILTLQLQNDLPHLWALVDADTQLVTERTFEVCGTGVTVPTPSTYIGTFQINAYVFHVFEVKD